MLNPLIWRIKEMGYFLIAFTILFMVMIYYGVDVDGDDI